MRWRRLPGLQDRSERQSCASDRAQRWLVLVAMCVTLGVQSGVRLAFSVFYVALRDAFGWSAAATAGVFASYMGVVALCSPLVGWVLDRYGARRLFSLAAVWVGLSLGYCSTIHTLGQFALGYGILLPMGQVALSSGAVSVVLARWFPEMRGRAIALADVGAALGMGIYSPWSQWLIGTYGWRWAFVVLGASVVLLLVPANCWQRRPPARPAERPPLPALQGAVASGSRSAPPDWSLLQALRVPVFWGLFGALCLSSLGLQVLNVHLVALLAQVGVSRMTAATVGGLVNMVSLGGRVGCGWVTDRVGRAPAYTMAMLCAMLGMGALLGMSRDNAAWMLVVFVTIYGISKGSGSIVIAAKAADVFQGERLGTIFGLISAASGLGGALGPWWAGWLVDRAGSYTPAIVWSVLMAGLSIGCMWLVERQSRSG